MVFELRFLVFQCLQTCVFRSDFGVFQPFSTEAFKFSPLINNFIDFLPKSVQRLIIDSIDDMEMNKQVDVNVESILDNIMATGKVILISIYFEQTSVE